MIKTTSKHIASQSFVLYEAVNDNPNESFAKFFIEFLFDLLEYFLFTYV